MAESYIVVLVTVPDAGVARRIAQTLLDAKKAACVNILPSLTSLYWWHSKLTEDNEVLLLIKTRAALFNEVAETVKSVHPSQVPEIIALPISTGNPEYLEWLNDALI